MSVRRIFRVLALMILLISRISFACFGGPSNNFKIDFKKPDNTNNLLVILTSSVENQSYVLEDDTGYLGIYFATIYFAKKYPKNPDASLENEAPNLAFIKERLVFMEEALQSIDRTAYPVENVLAKIAEMKTLVSVRDSTPSQVSSAFHNLDKAITKADLNINSKIKKSLGDSWQNNGNQSDFKKMIAAYSFPEFLDSRGCSSGIAEFNPLKKQSSLSDVLPSLDFSSIAQ